MRPPLVALGAGDDWDGQAGDAASGQFVAVAPCEREEDYRSGAATGTFGVLGPLQGFAYDPDCLKIDAGTIVAFSGDSSFHPLYPSRVRGTVQRNPIRGTNSARSMAVLFGEAGFYAYYCGVHGAFDDGSAMAGVIWVK
jgi:plastocyanin